MKDYKADKACNEIKRYIDELSTWYVRNARDRFNEGDAEARQTLRYVLERIVRILAPIIPFATEKIYQDMNGKKKSVHLEAWPKYDKKLINEELMEKMELVREIVSEGLKQRDQAKIGLKWPLAKAVIFTKEAKGLDKYEEIILEQLNVKKIDFKQSKEELKVELDTNITPELEAEGYAREISRKVQSFRRELGLQKSDKIELFVFSDNDLVKNLEKQKNFLSERVNAPKLTISSKRNKKFKNVQNFKVKEKEIEIAIEM
jgi:isoleucyl-tRNA synthetase